MYIIVVGCGRIGFNLTRALLTVGHEITVIDQDPLALESASREMSAVFLLGDGSSPDVLTEAGTERADLVIGVTGDDAANLAVCQMAKHLFKTPTAIGLIKHPSHAGLFRLLGVDRVINSSHLILSNIEEAVPSRALMHLLNLQTYGMDIVALSIPHDASVVGRTLADVEMPPNSFITLVVKQAGPRLPEEDLVLQAGDEVIAVTVLDEEQALYETLTGAA